MYGRKPRPKPTAPSPLSSQALTASDESIEGVRQRRKPRKQDVVAAVIAIAIVVAIVGSAVIPFFVF
jgi:hypothetical protein